MAKEQTTWRQRWRRRLRTAAIAAFAMAIIGSVAFLIYFPGRQTPIAFTLATGLGMPALQRRVDALQLKARESQGFSDEDRRFLRALYSCFPKGGRLTIVLRQSAAMMDRYLSCAGTPLQVEPRIFLSSGKVRTEMDALRRHAQEDSRHSLVGKNEYRSREFYMADAGSFDAVVGLYFGRIVLRPNHAERELTWRAEMPWQWPAYGDGPAALASFPIPNLRSLLGGQQYALQIEDGLGEHLARIGLAKPFLVYAEWTEAE